MKKYLSIFLIICLLIPFIGTYTRLQVEKYQVKRRIKWRLLQEMPRERLVLLKFTIQESQTVLHWEHSKEFEYQGEMYDVLSFKKLGDSIFYRCWKDTEETQIKQKIRRLVAQALSQNPQNRENHNQLRLWMESLWYMQAFRWQESSFQDFIFEHIFFYSKPCLSFFISPFTLPPEYSFLK